MSNLASKVVCINLRKTCLGTSFVDQSLTNRLEQATGAAPKKVKGSKKILGDALKPIRSIMRDVGEFVKQNSLPGISDDLRIITPNLLAKVRDEVATAEQNIAAEVAKFGETIVFHPPDGSEPYETSVWQSLIEQDRFDLKEAFDPNDYPPMENLDTFFTLRLTTCDLPAGDFHRIEGLTDEAVHKLKADHEKMIAAVSATAKNEVQKKTLELIGHIADKLSDPDAKKFYDSTFTNLHDYLAKIPDLNITNDPVVEALRLEAQNKLSYSMEQVKNSMILKEKAAEAAKSILSKFAGGTRKVLVADPVTETSAA